jgi:phosphoglycerate dehydrogenase-like enzyme
VQLFLRSPRMSSTTVAIIDPFAPTIRERIEAAMPADWIVRFGDAGPAQRDAAVAGADVLFVMAAPVPGELIDKARKLRFIQKLGAGVDRVDQAACVARGIALAKLAAGNAVPVAEHTVLLMLACYRRLPHVDRLTRSGHWGKEEARSVHRQLRGKRIGLVGFGAIGREVATILTGFQVELVYFDPMPAAPELEARLQVRRLPLDELIDTSDIVSLHLPLTPETAGLIDTVRIRRMKRGAVLINAARGGLVDEGALAAALADGHLACAGLDAFSREPPTGNPLLASEATVVTPHMAGATIDNFGAIIERAVANAQTYLATGRLPDGDAVLVPGGSAPHTVAASADVGNHTG